MAETPRSEQRTIAAADTAGQSAGVAVPARAAASQVGAGRAGADSGVVGAPPPELPPRSFVRRRRSLWIAAAVIGVIVLSVIFGVPFVIRVINTVSTDDAYVNGHVTFVAPRVAGQVVKVLVDDNDRVRKGDLLVQLDREPFQVIVDQKRAALDVAQSNLVVAKDQTRAMVGQARASRYKLERTIEDVNNQVAVLRANVAAVQTSEAKLALAQSDYQRAVELQKTPGAISQQDVDLRQEALRSAEAQRKQSLQQVYQVRASLGLPMEPEKGQELSTTPADLDQNFSSVREALFQLLQTVAPLGILPSSYNLTPKQVIAEFYARDPQGNLDKIYAKIIQDAPGIKFAQSQVMVAQSDLAQAELNVRYCDVLAEIDGVVTRRQVNPGNNLVAGQNVLALRSLTEIWIDANFKETQLARIRIGQPVDLDVDMYGSHRMFKGRVQGFTMGTGSTLALLPSENATGNFVKVVQRLPVRIELTDYDPDKTPLFVGLSVTPYVYINAAPTGPDAGTVLRPYSQLPERPLDPKLPLPKQGKMP